MRRYSNRNKMSGKILSTLYYLMIFSITFIFLTLSPISCLISTKFSLILGNIFWEDGGGEDFHVTYWRQITIISFNMLSGGWSTSQLEEACRLLLPLIIKIISLQGKKNIENVRINQKETRMFRIAKIKTDLK